MTVTDAFSVRAVPGELSYLAPESTVLRRFTAPGTSVNTGIYRVVRDADPQRPPGRGPVHARPQRLRDRRAPLGGDGLHRPGGGRPGLRRRGGRVREVLHRRRPGGDAGLDAAPLRGAHARTPRSRRPPWCTTTSRSSARASGPRTAYAAHFPDGPGFHRALITSLWRVFSPPPQDWPLAICDYTSVGPDEGLDNRLYFVDEIPDDLYAEMPAGRPRAPAASSSTTIADHQWWYFPDMTRDEILFFKLNDSDHSRAWRVPHTAFHDKTAQATQPRHSIEFRSIAYFE